VFAVVIQKDTVVELLLFFVLVLLFLPH